MTIGSALGNATGSIATEHVTSYGSWTVNLAVSDGTLTSTASATVAVNDVTPPVLRVPQDLTVRRDASEQSSVAAFLAGASATDDHGPDFPVTIANDYTGGATPAAGTLARGQRLRRAYVCA